MFEIKNLNFSFEKEKPLLNNVSLKAKPGDIIWLKGPNGCGKTTLLRIIAQLIETDFKLYYNDKLLESREEILSDIIYIPSEPYLFDYLTGKENAEFLQSLFNIPKSSFSNSFEEMIKQFQLQDALNQFVQEYSLGMRHKLYWSAVFTRKASIILLDEPFSSLDVDSQKTAVNMLIKKANEGAIIIFVSHLTEIGNKLATSQFVIKERKLSKIS